MCCAVKARLMQQHQLKASRQQWLQQLLGCEHVWTNFWLVCIACEYHQQASGVEQFHEDVWQAALLLRLIPYKNMVHCKECSTNSASRSAADVSGNV